MPDTPEKPDVPGTPDAPAPKKPEAVTPEPKTEVLKDTPPKAEPAKPVPPKAEPFKPEGTAPAAPPRPDAPNRWSPPEGTPAPAAGQVGSPYTPPRPKRTSEEIRADIERQRQELGQNVDHLRDKVTELTDWRSQLRKHRKQIVIGAVATGFVVGGLMALRRR
jgi:hypothetical protein